MSLPDTVARFVADTKPFDAPLDASARVVGAWGRAADRASLQARRALLAAADAADKAAASQKAAADAAEKLAKGEIKEAEAARLAAQAAKDAERASIAQREAQLAAADAADKAAAQQRQLARDAELAAAAQQLGALKAAGATRDYNALLERLKAEHGDLSRTAIAGFEAMEEEGNKVYQALDSASASLAEVNKLWVVGAVNGLTLLPSLASAAAGALTVGLGGAMTAVGMLIASKNAQIRAEYKALGHDIWSSLQSDAEPFVQVLDHAAAEGAAEFKSWEPTIRKVFSILAPTADKAIAAVLHSLDEFKPAAVEVSRAFSAVMAAVDKSAGEDAHNIATGIEAIAHAAQENPQALASLITGLSEMVRYGGDVIGFLVRFGHEIQTVLNIMGAGGPVELMQFVHGLSSLGGWLGKVTGLSHGASSGAKDLSGALDQAGQSTESMASHAQQLRTAQDLAAMSTDKLKHALDDLTNANQSAFDSQTQYGQALAAAAEQAKKSNAGISANTEAGRKNRQVLSDLAQASRQYIENNKLSAAQIEKVRQAFIKQAEGMGVSKTAAKKLADQLLGVSGNMKKIPDKKTTKLTAKDETKPPVASAKKNANSFADGLYRATLTAKNSIGGVVHEATSMAKNFASGNYRAVLRAANLVRSAYDAAMALGRSWEHQVFTATFNVIRQIFGAGGGYIEGYADGGPVKRFPSGGPVVGPGTGTSDSVPAMLSNGEYVINAEQTRKYRPLLDMINYGVGGFASGGSVSLAKARPEYLAALAAQESLQRMRNTVYGGWFSGGPSFVGSAHGSVVQHTTHLHITVQGSVVTERQLVEVVRQGLAQRSVLNAGRNGAAIPRTV